MVTYFIGEIQDVFESEYVKKETGELVKTFEVTATFKKRSSNGKLYMFTEHFRFSGDQGQKLKNALGKFIIVPFEKRQFGQNISITQNRDLGFEILDKNPFESKTEGIKKAS